MKNLPAMLLLAALLPATAGHAHEPEPASPATARRGGGPQALPPWEQLTPAQRELLVAPVRERWNASPDDRARMLERARRWQEMPPGQRARARRGMKRWEHMDPATRAGMRILFERTRGMSPQQRRETFALYHNMRRMTPEQREALRKRWAEMTPAQRQEWMREHAPRRMRIRHEP